MKKKDIEHSIKKIETLTSGLKEELDHKELKKHTNIVIESFKQLHEKTEKQKKTHKKLAFEDPLCGIFNRRRFDYLLDLEINRAKRNITTFSLIMFDLDKFKIINDSFGHDAGDIVLKETARAIRKKIRSTDIFARWGGDEFIILVPGTSTLDAAVLAEKLRILISSIEIDDCPQLTGSFGIAEYIPGDTAKEIIIRADMALYRAKNSGRNRVCFNSDDKYLAEEKLTLTKVSLPKEVKNLKQLTYKIDMIENAKSLHNLVVAGYAEGIAKTSGIKKTEDLANIRTAALLHDIGKICIPFKIISKKGKLTEKEKGIIHKHSEYSAVIAKNILNSDRIYDIILSHHERFDGTGYPNGLKGDKIPCGSRILAIADTFHVLLFGRIYKKSTSIDLAVKEVENHSGTQFDPYYVKVFKDWVKSNFMAKA